MYRIRKLLHSKEWSTSDVLLWQKSPFAAWMEGVMRWHPEHELCKYIDPPDEMMQLLAAKGRTWELEVLDQLRTNRNLIVKPKDIQETIHACTSSSSTLCELVYQARLSDGQIRGIADFMILEDDGVSYSIWDAKSASRTRPDDLMQITAYSELAKSCGIKIARYGVIAHRGGYEAFDLDLHSARWRRLQNDFLNDFSSSFDPKNCAPPFPRGDVPSTAHGRWQKLAEGMLKEKDDLRFVAGCTARQRKFLRKAGIDTLTQLASLGRKNNDPHVPGLRKDITNKLLDQARLQQKSIHENVIAWKQVRPLVLPKGSQHDIFFDLEGDPLFATTNDSNLPRDYLWGSVVSDTYHADWALDQDTEIQCYLTFLHKTEQAWQQHNAHVYHFGHYELASLRRLAISTNSEKRLESLVRDGVFVDLYKRIKRSLIIGTTSYSLKSIEKLYRQGRSLQVNDAQGSVIAYETYLASQDSSLLDAIESYNKDDCFSTRELVTWLRTNVPDIIYDDTTTSLENSSPSRDEDIIQESNTERCIRILKELCPKSLLDETAREACLGWLEYHAREQRPLWRQRREWFDALPSELSDDDRCVGQAWFVKEIFVDNAESGKNKKRRGSYLIKAPIQPTRLSPPQRVTLRDDENTLEEDQKYPAANVASIIQNNTNIQITLLSSKPPPAKFSLIPDEFVNPEPIPTALTENILQILTTKNDIHERNALTDFIARRSPRFCSNDKKIEKIDLKNIDDVSSAVAMLDRSILAVQGPPGTGKTFVAAQSVARLAANGRRVVITASSHNAIEHVMSKALSLVDCCFLKLGQRAKAGRSNNDMGDEFSDKIMRRVSLDAKALKIIKEANACVIGATAWTLARPEARNLFDTVFVDEAGQMPAATLAAIACCASNIVLLGDQAQLPAPTRAAHPPGHTASSCLEYYLHGETPPDYIFLKTTRRLRPELCSVVSRLSYNDRLISHSEAQNRYLIRQGNDPFPNAGLCLVNVHSTSDNDLSLQSVNENIAEARAVATVVQTLLANRALPERKLTQADVLVVAPYNAHTRLIQSELQARNLSHVAVGTVDRFQGKEAPLVVASLCAVGGQDEDDPSLLDDLSSSPRSIAFVLDTRRLNVALSRAQCLAVLIASPHALDSPATSIEKMVLLAQFATLAEIAHSTLTFDHTNDISHDSYINKINKIN